MSVLIEDISIVLRIEAIIEKYAGGWEAFLDACPNETICHDHELVRIGFTVPDDASTFCDELERRGITTPRTGSTEDMALVEPCRGASQQANWLVLSMARIDENTEVLCASHIECESSKLMLPREWSHARTAAEQQQPPRSEQAPQQHARTRNPSPRTEHR